MSPPSPPSGLSGRKRLFVLPLCSELTQRFTRAPYIVVVTDRGRSLRFYKASQIRLNDEIVREFLKEEGWKSIQPWNTAYSPGGDRLVHGAFPLV